jgi:hypothetical protein
MNPAGGYPVRKGKEQLEHAENPFPNFPAHPVILQTKCLFNVL